MRRMLSLLVALTLTAACGSSESSDEAASAVSADETASDSTVGESEPETDGESDTEGEPAAAEAAFPVTIAHAFGETIIETKPERVAAVAWGNHEVPIALGIVPVGMAKVTWGDDDDNGVLPWVEDALAGLGAETPVLFDETDGIDFEGVADTQPDLILAAYSGLSQEDYDLLSKIAPVVAYPEVAWGTSVQDLILISSAALGLAEEGAELVEDLDSTVAAALSNYPALEGKRILFSYINPPDLSQIGFYTSHDTRPGFLMGMGFPQPTIVVEESAKTSDFYVGVSSELADEFDDVDIFVTYGEADGAIIDLMQADLLLAEIPAVANGAVAILENSTPLAASANPSPLSIAWGIEDYFELLNAALATAE